MYAESFTSVRRKRFSLNCGHLRNYRSGNTPDRRAVAVMLLAPVPSALALTTRSDNVSTTAANSEISQIQEVAERVRRPERWAEDKQPEAVSSEKRSAAQRWQVFGLVSLPAGGKNTSRKEIRMGPYKAATKLAAEQARDEDIDDWLHAPVRSAPKKQKMTEADETDGCRIKRKAAPIELCESSATRGPKQGQGKAGPGCVATACL